MLVKQVKAAKNRPFQDGFGWWTLTGSNRRPSARQATNRNAQKRRRVAGFRTSTIVRVTPV